MPVSDCRAFSECTLKKRAAPPPDMPVQTLTLLSAVSIFDKRQISPLRPLPAQWVEQDKLVTFLNQQGMSCCPSTVLYHGAEGGGAVCGHGSGGVAICRGVGPHQECAAIYGVLPLLRGRRQVWQGNRGVGNIGLEPVYHDVHLARHHGNPAMTCR